jgi:hypothetical protein
MSNESMLSQSSHDGYVLAYEKAKTLALICKNLRSIRAMNFCQEYFNEGIVFCPKW